MTQTFKPNTQGYKVLTPDGFKPFAGVDLMGIRPIIRLEFEKDAWIECTFDHKLYISDTEYRCACDFEIGDTVSSSEGDLKLINKVDLNRTEAVYDLIEVADGHRYYANGILSSNCKFLVFDETLINSISLADITGGEPMMKMGQARWYKKINPNCTYIVSLDPSLGTGGDYAAIEIIEVPTMEQVCEWNHNMTPVQAQARILRDLLKYIEEQCANQGMPSSIYYSVENNAIGEAALVAINEMGEESFPGLFLSEPVRKGHVRRFRKGFNTTHSTKLSACAKLKQLIETRTIKIHSKPLITELKTYVASGITYKAKTGQTDDLVASLLLNIRMIMLLQDWDPSIYEKMRDHEGLAEYDLPLPIYISTY
jgi:hypothetical protein